MSRPCRQTYLAARCWRGRLLEIRLADFKMNLSPPSGHALPRDPDDVSCRFRPHGQSPCGQFCSLIFCLFHQGPQTYIYFASWQHFEQWNFCSRYSAHRSQVTNSFSKNEFCKSFLPIGNHIASPCVLQILMSLTNKWNHKFRPTDVMLGDKMNYNSVERLCQPHVQSLFRAHVPGKYKGTARSIDIKQTFSPLQLIQLPLRA